MISRILILSFLCSFACGPAPSIDTPFEYGKAMGVNTNEHLEEASGLAASVRYPGYFWSHNDSGHHADLFLLDAQGQTKAEFRLAKIKNRDWEDIALGPGPGEGNYIYLGDIGDNLLRYPVKYIYRLKEPALDQVGKLHDVDTLIIKLSDKPRDTETLMIDPITRNLYLVSKHEKKVWLYEIAFPFLGDTLTANRIVSLPLRHVVAGDISRDGKEILLKSYDHIYYWKRSGDESITEVLQTPAVELAYDREPMGEAITWATDGSGFFTLGENARGGRAQLFFYQRRQQSSPDSIMVKNQSSR